MTKSRWYGRNYSVVPHSDTDGEKNMTGKYLIMRDDVRVELDMTKYDDNMEVIRDLTMEQTYGSGASDIISFEPTHEELQNLRDFLITEYGVPQDHTATMSLKATWGQEVHEARTLRDQYHEELGDVKAEVERLTAENNLLRNQIGPEWFEPTSHPDTVSAYPKLAANAAYGRTGDATESIILPLGVFRDMLNMIGGDK